MTEAMTDSRPVLAVSNLQIYYGAALAVSDVSFEVPSGSVVTVLGANGAGKSSVARACSGLVPVTSGSIHLNGADVTKWQAAEIRRAGLVYLPEGRGVFPNLSVWENLRLAVRLVPDRKEALELALQFFPILDKRRGQRAGSLSGGEQQMLSLARALASRPKVAIIDEPSLGLAPKIIDQVFESLHQAKQFGMTMVVIEQFAHRALALSDHCIILRQGKVSWAGPATTSPDEITAHYLGS
jgi:branched-chain amino acid transport system ATP-binding protein